MLSDINGYLKKELEDIKRIIRGIEALYHVDVKTGSDSANKIGASDKEEIVTLTSRGSTEGVVYDMRGKGKGKHYSKRLGGADDPRVIRIKQDAFNRVLMKRLLKDQKLLEKVVGKFVPYDQDSIDLELGEVYRDVTGLVNKAPGIVNMDEWNKIVEKNGYPMDDACNVAPDGERTRSKSELIIYGILKGYGLVIKYDYEITLRDDIGQKVKISPDFIILCADGSLIVIEHLGLVDKSDYTENAIRRIHLYLINGFKLNESLFLTADYAQGKIDARVIDELVRNMILPRVHRGA